MYRLLVILTAATILLPCRIAAQGEEKKVDSKEIHIKSITIIDGDTSIQEKVIKGDPKEFHWFGDTENDSVLVFDKSLKRTMHDSLHVLVLPEHHKVIKDGKQLRLEVFIEDDGDSLLLKDPAMKAEKELLRTYRIELDSMLNLDAYYLDSLEGVPTKKLIYHKQLELENLDEPYKLLLKEFPDAIPQMEGVEIYRLSTPWPGHARNIEIQQVCCSGLCLRFDANRMKQEVTISKLTDGKYYIVVEDESGQKMFESKAKFGKGSYSWNLDLSDYQDGTYFVTVKHGKYSIIKKLIVG